MSHAPRLALLSLPRRYPTQVVEHDLALYMALRACSNASISNSALSRELARAISQRAEEEAKIIRMKQQEDDDDVAVVSPPEALTPSSVVDETLPYDRRKRRRSSEDRRSVSSDGPSSSAMKRKIDEWSSLHMRIRFSSPFLKGKPTHFQRKVAAKADQLLEKDPPPRILHLRRPPSLSQGKQAISETSSGGTIRNTVATLGLDTPVP